MLASGRLALTLPAPGMLSPQNLAIGAAAVGMAGQEGDIFRRVLKWSLILVLVMCVLVFLQSTPILGWMVVGPAP